MPLPRSFIRPVPVVVSETLSVLVVIGHERHDLVVCNPLVFLADPLGLRCVAPLRLNREPVEVPETLGRPSQVEYTPEDVPLDLA